MIDAKQSSCCNLWSVSPGMRRMRRLIRTRRLSMTSRRGRIYWIKNRYRGCSWAFLGDPVRAKVAKEATSILKSFYGASVAPSRGFRYSRPKPYGNTRCSLAIWLANVFSIKALLSSLIGRPVGGSGAVRISLASEISDHCFVEVLFYRKFVFTLFSPGMCTSL